MERRGRLIVPGMARQLVGGAAGAASLAARAARHAAWYLRYHVDGTSRDDEQARRRPR
jgi:hypothetical protein